MMSFNYILVGPKYMTKLGLGTIYISNWERSERTFSMLSSDLCYMKFWQGSHFQGPNWKRAVEDEMP